VRSVVVGLLLALVATMAGSASAAWGAVRTGQPGQYATDYHQLGAEASVAVDLFSGNLLFTQEDLVPADATFWVAYGKSYNSLADSQNTGLGPRWALSVGPSVRLQTGSSQVVVFGPNGYRQQFTGSGTGQLAAPAGSDAVLVRSPDGSYTLTQPLLHTTLTFNSSGVLTNVVDAANRAFTVTSTSAAGQTVLSSYGTAGGQRINASYNGDARIREIDDPASAHRYYFYDPSGRLSRYEAPAGTTTYAYDANGYLNDVDLPDGTTVSTVNLADGRVSSLTITSSGNVAETTTYTYGQDDTTTVGFPNGGQQDYGFDSEGRLSENPAVAAEAAAFYTADTGSTIQEAKAVLALQNQAAPLGDRLNLGLGDFYTGMWVDDTDRRLKVSVAIGTPLPYLTTQIAELGLTAQTDIVQREATWADLTGAQESVESQLATLLNDGLVELSIRPDLGSVQIDKANSLNTAQEQQISDAVQSSPVPVNVQPQPYAVLTSEPASCSATALCTPPIRGGQHIQATQGNAAVNSCSAGFYVQSNSDNLPYILTAGHCLVLGDGPIYSSQLSDGQFGAREIGTRHSWVFGNNFRHPSTVDGRDGDAGIFSITSAFWKKGLAPYITVWASESENSDYQERYPIIGTRYTPRDYKTVQWLMCAAGAPIVEDEFGEDVPQGDMMCGRVTGINAVAEYGESTVRHLGKVNMCADDYRTTGIRGGMSGGPVFVGNAAYGIVSGRSEPNGCTLYYQSVNDAADALGVHVVTGG
jgi:YD repeat-containing protein